jgi:hypothetical protein
MSHIIQVKHVQMTDPEAVKAGVERIEGAKLIDGMNVRTYTLYSQKYTGVGIQLEGWHYPVILDLEKGTIYYDNYGGSWGDQARLDELAQAYTVEKMRLEAVQRGYAVQEQEQEDESIQLVLTQY